MAELHRTSIDANPDLGSSLQHQAILSAKAAISSLDDGSHIFRECLESTEPLPILVQSLLKTGSKYADSRSTRILGRFQKHSLWLQNMAPAIDVVVNVQAGIAAPIWAPIRYVLKISKDHADAADCILRMIDAISDCLPRVQLYEKLNSHPALQTALLQLFTSVVEFTILTLRYLSRGAFSRVTHLAGRGFDSIFDDAINRLKRHAKAIDETAVATELTAAAQYRQKTERLYSQDLRIRCAEWLKPLNIQDYQERNMREHLEGTCEWILEESSFRSWIVPTSASPKRILLICGNAGCGKSILASWLKEYLASKSTRVLFFAFSTTISNRLATEDLIRSIIWQALSIIDKPECWEIVHVLMAKGPATSETLWSTLNNILKHDVEQWSLLIDGIDECHEIDELINTRIPVLMTVNPELSIALIGRPQITQQQAVLSLYYQIQISPSHLKKDIHAFIAHRIERSPFLRQSSLKGSLSKKLQLKSAGMFLWVKLMIDDLQRASNNKELSLRLRSLPVGLTKTYRHLLSGIHSRLEDDPNTLLLVKSVFALIIAGGRLFSFDELRYAIGLQAMLASDCFQDTTQLQSFIPRLPPERIFTICGNLVIRSGDHIKLIHASLHEFLTRPEKDWASEKYPEVLFFRPFLEQTNSVLASVCLCYLQLNDYGFPWDHNDLEHDSQAQHPFLDYSIENVMLHVSESGHPSTILVETVKTFLNSRYCVSWLEYLFLYITDDSRLLGFRLDLDGMLAWIECSGEAEEICNIIKRLFRDELKRRLETSGESSMGVERWALSTRLAERLFEDIEIPLSKPLDVAQGPSKLKRGITSFTKSTELAVLTKRTTELLNRSLLKRLGSGFQLDMLLMLANISAKATRLTDPLEALFQLILQKSDSIPNLILLSIIEMYEHFGENDKAIKVVKAALKKLEGTDSFIEFELVSKLAFWHYNLREYDQALVYFQREASERRMLGGERCSNAATATINVGSCLNFLGRTEEAQTVLFELLELDNQVRFLEPAERVKLYALVGSSHSINATYKESAYWFERALDSAIRDTPLMVRSIKLALSYCSYHLAEWEKSSRLYNEAVQLPENKGWTGAEAPSKYCQGMITMRQNKEGALDYFQQALQNWNAKTDSVSIKIDILESIVELGDSYFASGSYRESLNCYQIFHDKTVGVHSECIRLVHLSILREARTLFALERYEELLTLLCRNEPELKKNGSTRDEFLLHEKSLIGASQHNLRLQKNGHLDRERYDAARMKKQKSLDNFQKLETGHKDSDIMEVSRCYTSHRRFSFAGCSERPFWI